MSAVMISAALDAAFGEPPLRWHPVVWTGRYLQFAGRRVPASPPAASMLRGGAGWAIGATAAVACGAAITRIARCLPASGSAAVTGLAMWPLLSVRLLLHEVAAVEAALEHDVAAGRAALSRIVSRDTAVLTEEEVRASAVESLAENLSDSVVAPLFWFSVAGLPGATLYRFSNTADAMWGYRTPRWEYAGKVSARADDLLNLLPARLTAAMLLIGADRGSWCRIIADARRTPSPNSGWPMAALALRLNLRLTKPGIYVLNPDAAAPQPEDTAAALTLARRTALGAFLAAAGVAHVRRIQRSHPARHKEAI